MYSISLNLGVISQVFECDRLESSSWSRYSLHVGTQDCQPSILIEFNAFKHRDLFNVWLEIPQNFFALSTCWKAFDESKIASTAVRVHQQASCHREWSQISRRILDLHPQNAQSNIGPENIRLYPVLCRIKAEMGHKCWDFHHGWSIALLSVICRAKAKACEIIIVKGRLDSYLWV